MIHSAIIREKISGDFALRDIVLRTVIDAEPLKYSLVWDEGLNPMHFGIMLRRGIEDRLPSMSVQANIIWAQDRAGMRRIVDIKNICNRFTLT
jgi:hypothetical protein